MLRRFALVAAMAVAFQVATPDVAMAQEPATNEISAGPKGLIGLGLIGAELGFVVPALAGMDGAWPYIVFPLVGGAGGAVAGHFLLDQNDLTGASVGMLVTGLTLVVPTILLTLVLTAYDPADEMEDDESLDSGPGDGEEEPEESARARVRRIASMGGGLIRTGYGDVQVGVPGVNVSPLYSQVESQRFGVDRGTQFQLSLVSGAF